MWAKQKKDKSTELLVFKVIDQKIIKEYPKKIKFYNRKIAQKLGQAETITVR